MDIDEAETILLNFIEKAEGLSKGPSAHYSDERWALKTLHSLSSSFYNCKTGDAVVIYKKIPLKDDSGWKPYERLLQPGVVGRIIERQKDRDGKKLYLVKILDTKAAPELCDARYRIFSLSEDYVRQATREEMADNWIKEDKEIRAHFEETEVEI